MGFRRTGGHSVSEIVHEERWKGRTFVVMFWAVVPLVQRGEVLVVIGWDI